MTLFYYPNGRSFKCDGCAKEVATTEERFWDALDKKRYCVKCGTNRGGIPTVSSASEASTSTPQSTSTSRASSTTATNEEPRVSSTTYERKDARCDLCGQWYDGRQGGMFYNAQHEAYRVCSFCQRVILCQAHAKIAGFWVVARRPGSVTEKAAAKEEAERHD